MIVVYDKETKAFVGMAFQIFDGQKQRDYTLEELYPNLDRSKLGFFYTDDSFEHLKLGNKVKFKLGKKGEVIGLEPISTLRLQITTDAPDRDQDGMPELVTDFQRTGTTMFQDKAFSAWVRVQVMDGDKPAAMSVAVQLSTTGGSLLSRYLTTDSTGKAETRIAPGNETVTLSVTATAGDMPPASLTFEVVPSTDVPALNARLKR